MFCRCWFRHGAALPLISVLKSAASSSCCSSCSSCDPYHPQHMVSENKVPPKSPFWEVKWWPVDHLDHLPVPHPFPIRSSWLYIPLWCDVGIFGMVYGIVLPCFTHRQFPLYHGCLPTQRWNKPEVLSSRPSMWDLHRHPSCEQNGGRFLVAEHGGCSQVLSQFVGNLGDSPCFFLCDSWI